MRKIHAHTQAWTPTILSKVRHFTHVATMGLRINGLWEENDLWKMIIVFPIQQQLID